MPRVSVFVDAKEVLDELDVDDLREEIERREKRTSPQGTTTVAAHELLERAYYDLRGKEVPQSLREYFYVVLGRVL